MVQVEIILLSANSSSFNNKIRFYVFFDMTMISMICPYAFVGLVVTKIQFIFLQKSKSGYVQISMFKIPDIGSQFPLPLSNLIIIRDLSYVTFEWFVETCLNYSRIKLRTAKHCVLSIGYGLVLSINFRQGDIRMTNTLLITQLELTQFFVMTCFYILIGLLCCR